jgi:putative restriction endonuclease
MPTLPAPLLIESVVSALEESGVAAAVLISGSQRHPRRFFVQLDSNSFELWVYIWTVTHGGGSARPKDEYRIQLTGVTAPLPLNANGPTVLIGYEPNLQCFAGFDLRKHRRFSSYSPSIQIPITALQAALQNGFSFVKKGNDEIAIGFRPDQFLAYALHAPQLHSEGAAPKTVELLSKAAALEPISRAELTRLPKERQLVIITVAKLSRDSAFRRKVKVAYDRRCAVTRMQLRLVDAAHILPVGAKGSHDEVSNGLCLTPTYHRAYDRSLIYLDEDLVMRINTAREGELGRLGLDGGLKDLKAYLNRKIHLPSDRNQWPEVSLIRKANEFRRI